MTSAPADVSHALRRSDRPAASWWLLIGRLATIAAVGGSLLLQWLNADWFPPEISVSQYGIGPRGWIFTCWSALLALSMLGLTRGGPASGAGRRRVVNFSLVIGCLGLLVMGIVRTDAGGAQHSWHARTHQVASILALLALPVCIVLAMGWAGRPWRRAALALAGLSAVSLLLVLASALGMPTPGMDAAQSWAFWQSVAVTVDLLLVGVFAIAGTGRLRPAATVTDRR